MTTPEREFTGAEAAGYLPRSQLQRLLDQLLAEGYRCLGPVVEGGEIRYAGVERSEQLARGVRVTLAPGSYQLVREDTSGSFSCSPGAQTLKPLLFPPREALWRNSLGKDGALDFQFVAEQTSPLAVIGVRACDFAALALLDRHFLTGEDGDPHYRARREALLLIGVDCAIPAATCFCAATGDGPAIEEGADLIVTELSDGFILRPGSSRGNRIVDALSLSPATGGQLQEGRALGQKAAAMQTRRLPPGDLSSGINQRLGHGYWELVGSRCLSCGNCTAVCPTCFCHGTHTELTLDGSVATQVREWDSCYAPDHSSLHGHPLRRDTAMRYRQWLSHKFANWQAQFGRIGCVGCGRCITWCPVGIDVTQVLQELLEETPP
jgi:sulfhydrogenase subunit beta (sulfur reductase)